MKLDKKNMYIFVFIILVLFFSYSLCQTHEKPTSGNVSKRNSFCSTPFYITFLIFFVLFLYLTFGK
jgi:hypothetical protein